MAPKVLHVENFPEVLASKAKVWAFEHRVTLRQTVIEAVERLVVPKQRSGANEIVEHKDGSMTIGDMLVRGPTETPLDAVGEVSGKGKVSLRGKKKICPHGNSEGHFCLKCNRTV